MSHFHRRPQRAVPFFFLGLGVFSAWVVGTPPRPPVIPPGDGPPPPNQLPDPPTYDTKLYIDPIPGLTTARHVAPLEITVPVGTVLRVRQFTPAGGVWWTGANEVAVEDSSSVAECPMPTPGQFFVRAVVFRPDGNHWVNTCTVTAVQLPRDTITLRSLAPSVELVQLREDLTNDETMHYFFGDSIAKVTEIRASRSDAGKASVAPRRYRTSVDRAVFEVTTDPPGFESLMEVRIADGEPFLAGSKAYSFQDVGLRTVSVGPPGRERTIEVETYKVTITSHVSGEDILPEGEPITFTAVTDPPGFEDEITWLSSTKYGTATPVLGHGPTFTVQFDDTFGPEDAFQWLGVKADNAVFNQDQKGGPCCFPDTCVEGLTVADCHFQGGMPSGTADCGSAQCAPGPSTICITEVFPLFPPDPADPSPPLAWHVCLIKQGIKGVWIHSAAVRRPGETSFRKVLGPSGPAEIYVPYHDNSLRWYDMNEYGDQAVARVTLEDAGPYGTLLYVPGFNNNPNVVKEVRDRGIGYLCKECTVMKVRRARELLLWSMYDAGNYDNIFQYGFRDDGTITFRYGATGFPGDTNNGDHGGTAHMHNVLWHIHPDLNGDGKDNALYEEHDEVGTSTAADNRKPFNFGTEGALTWNPLKFTTIGVEDAAPNIHGNLMGYDLVPLRSGTSRHYGTTILQGNPTEHFTLNDFYVTQFHPNDPNEMAWTVPTIPYFPKSFPDCYLLGEVGCDGMGIGSPLDSVMNTDVVLWYISTVHHHPSDEDRPNLPPPFDYYVNGITSVHWAGFDLVPHNFFDFNPMGGPRRCSPICPDGVCNAPCENGCTCIADCCPAANCCSDNDSP